MVYALIPARNNKYDVLGLLVCLARQTFRDLKVVLVDDGSTDETEREVSTRFPQVTILRGNGKLWWAGANALGVSYLLGTAKVGDFILLINNDLTVDDNYVSLLVSSSEKLSRGVVGSTTVDCDNPEAIYGGIRLNQELRPVQTRDPGVINTTDWQVPVDVLPGRGTLVPIEVFQLVGNFNEKWLPHYGADYEFFIRARRAGFRLAVSHRARVHANLKQTGIHLSDRASFSWAECCQLAFSRRSSANLYYYLTYVWMCSEPGWRLRNAVSHGLGLLMDMFGKTVVGAPIAAGLRLCLRGLRNMRAS